MALPNLERKDLQLFANNAPAQDNISVFGSLASNNPQFTKDIEAVQSLPAFLQGWASAITGDSSPAMEDFNGLFYVLFYQMAYLFQKGIAQWKSTTDYYKGSFTTDGNGALYVSIVDNNVGNDPATDNGTHWNKFPTPAEVASKVAKAGDTMTGALKVNQSAITNVTGSAPASSQYGTAVALADKVGNNMGDIGTGYLTNGNTFSRILHRRVINGNAKFVDLSVGFEPDGSAYTSSPNPPANSNTNAIATTSWVRNQSVAKSGDTMSGQLVMANGSNGIRFNGPADEEGNDNYYYVKYGAQGLQQGDSRILTTADLGGGNTITPVGSLIMGPIPNTPAGYLLCDGQAVSRTTYAALFDVLGTNFGEGDGSTTFNVPDYRDCFLRGLGTKNNSFYVKQNEGLPDHNHTLTLMGRSRNSTANYSPGWGEDDVQNGPFTATVTNASASNSIYGAADEVRTTNYAINYFIKF